MSIKRAKWSGEALTSRKGRADYEARNKLGIKPGGGGLKDEARDLFATQRVEQLKVGDSERRRKRDSWGSSDFKEG